jgi:AcrR family transcriptional regulator
MGVSLAEPDGATGTDGSLTPMSVATTLAPMARSAATPAKRKKAAARPASPPRAVGGPGTPAKDRELRARGQRTMRKLLDAGVKVFSTKGYHSARVDDIVKVAKTSHGTFYLYFANKEDLFAALVQDVGDRLTELTASLEPIGPDDAGKAVLRSWIGEFVAVYDEYGSIIRTWTEAEVDESAAGQVGAGVLTNIASALADHLQDVPADTDADVAGLAVVALVERMNYFVHTGQVTHDRARVVRVLADVTHAGIFGR